MSALVLAIEIISPSSARTDRGTKREYYVNAGVPAYLVVDIDARQFEHWSAMRDTPLVLRDRWVWHLTGASSAMSIELPAFFDGIASMLNRLARA